MLGIKNIRKPIEGEAARNIRRAVKRVSMGNLNEEERALVKRSKEVVNRFDVHWVGLDGKEI